MFHRPAPQGARMFTKPINLAAEIDPRLPPHRLGQIAAELDRDANFALTIGRFLWAERASTRAEQLRELAGVVR